ncbi:MAG: type II toxin-antitoxin system RelE/ParE family toxin [Flavobacteriales bacterium]|nr:type II toxin-antitoxin system RelE/ParE family toxin [Flavobacteriales bacterium]
MSYTIEWLRSARKELDAIPARTAVRIVEAVGNLAEEPRPPGCKKLKGHDDLWRIRIGSYRVIYFIGDAIRLVRVEKVSDRKDAYR